MSQCSHPSCCLILVAIFLDPRIALIAANEASAVLDRATLHAFTGDEKTAFISILKETGDPFISSSEQLTVDVSKVAFSIGNMSDQSIQAATAAEAANVKVEDDRFNDATRWAGPALAIAASLVVIASAMASFILIQQRRNQYSYDEEHKNAMKPTSPTNTEAVTPSPTSFVGRFKKKFDFTEFDDSEDLSLSSKNLEYDFGPVAPQGIVQEQPTEFNCPSSIKLSHDLNRSCDDSTVSNVSAFIYSGTAKSPQQKNTTWADSEKSGIESQFQFDNLLGNDDDLQIDGSTPNFLVDDDSAFAGDVPSELYNMTMDDSATIQSHDPIAIYGANSLLENMKKARDTSFMDMPPPPSDAASETSSQPDFPSDPFYSQDAQDGTGEGYQKSINDELNKVMMILNEPATEDEKMENGGEDATSNMMYDVTYLQSAPSEDDEGVQHTDGSIQSSVLSEDDPVKLMNSALDDCMAILDKAKPNVEIV